MNENRKVAWIYVALTAVISGVSSVFQNILETHYLDTDIGLYKAGALTPEAFYIFLTIAALFIMTSAFVMRMDSLPKDLKHGSVLTSITAFVVSVLIIFSAVSFFMTDKSLAASGSTAETVYKLRFVCSLLAFPAAVYYFVVAFSGKTKSKFAPLFSFFPILWTLIYLMSIYFDHTVLINSPIRVIQQLALIILMLYQLFETRAMLGRSKPIIYFMLCSFAVLFLTSAFVPEIIALMNGKNSLSLQTSYYLYGGGISLYILSRAIDFALLCGDGQKKHFVSKFKPKDDIFTADEETEEEAESEK